MEKRTVSNSVGVVLVHKFGLLLLGSIIAFMPLAHGEALSSEAAIRGSREEVCQFLPSKAVNLGVDDSEEFIRLGGSNRYTTAVAISEETWDSAETVVLTSGLDFPDALSGAPLAYLNNGPILLTRQDSIPPVTMSEIERLGVRNIYILGGAGAVSEEVARDLELMGYNVERLRGTNRYSTAVTIGERIRAQQSFDTVIIAVGDDFPDALAVSPHAARNGFPVLFTRHDSLHSHTKQALLEWDVSNVVIVGGTGAVSQAVADEIASLGIVVERLHGANRYATALVITQYFAGDSNSIVLATGEDFPDALTGGVLAAKLGAPILLSRQDRVFDAGVSYIRTHINEDIYLLGGEGAVSDIIFDRIFPEFLFRGIAIGDTKEHVWGVLGEPDRKDLSFYGFYWYIYKQDYSQYIQVGIDEGRVVALATAACYWSSKQDVAFGSSREEVESIYGEPLPHIRKGDTVFYPKYHHFIDNSYVYFFYDIHERDTVTAILTVEKETEQSLHGWFGEPTEELRESFERQMFDLANVARVRYGIEPYEWCDVVAQIARDHSIEMAENNYFNHTSLDGRSPFDRMRDGGIDYTRAAENISMGYTSSLHSHVGLMNSEGHRRNILGLCERLGVGVGFNQKGRPYYTQKFYTPR